MFQELENRIMGEKKHNLSGPNPQPLRILSDMLTVQHESLYTEFDQSTVHLQQ